MSLSIVVGGQYGSEGKGKVAYLWAKKMRAVAAVRVGGSNSGHTVYDENGRMFVFRMLPTASIIPSVICILPAGSYIDVEVLLREASSIGLSEERLVIDPNAAIITPDNGQFEQKVSLREAVGSTLSGTGATVAKRVMRNPQNPVLLAKDEPKLARYLRDTKALMRSMLDANEHIVIEGTQGYGLSNLHAKAYPYATSRDTTAAGFLSETGLSPLDVEHVVMVIRAFPIRVAGNSGPLINEIDWRTVSVESGAGEYFDERTSVTHKLRRVARFDPIIVRDALLANRADVIVMNHLDYLDYSHHGQSELSSVQLTFVNQVECSIGQRLNFLGNDGRSMIVR